MGKAITIHLQDDILLCASFGELLLVVDVGAIQVPHLEKIERAVNTVASGSPDGKLISLSCYYVNQSGLIKAKETRDKMNQLLSRSKQVTRASATILGSPGIASGALRAIVTTTIALMRSPYPNKIFTDIAEATDWLLPQADSSWSASDRATCRRDILRLDQQMRATIAA